MHIAIIGATAFFLFVIMGGLFTSAVVLEQRTRRKMAEAAAATSEVQPNEPTPAAEQAPKAMAAAAGR
jgi:hypothetical protein